MADKHLSTVKISFITTVLNEEESVKSLLDSINSQTIIPSEVIIVDGGSKDKTVDIIESFKNSEKNGLDIKVIKSSGNRSKGRNAAIKESSGDVIAVTDAGCIPDKDWIEKITENFKNPKTDVVAGFYRPKTKNIFQKSLSTYTCVMPERLDPMNFLPSSRSIAFRKKAWEKVGGYPEFLDTCEDLYFARELRRNGFKFKTSKDAMVTWFQKENLREAFLQFYKYAEGDGMARYFRKNTPFLFVRYIAGFILLLILFHSRSLYLLLSIVFLLGLYLLWSITKNYRYVNDVQAFFYLPLLQLTSDIAVLSGTSLGLLRSFSIKR